MAEEETKVKVKVVAIDTASLFHFHIFLNVKSVIPVHNKYRLQVGKLPLV